MQSNASNDLEPIPGLIFSDEELASSLQDETLTHPQRILQFPMRSDASDELEPIPGLIYSDDELASRHETRMQRQEPTRLADTGLEETMPPRRGRTRSAIPIGDRLRSRHSYVGRSPTPAPRILDPGHSSLAGAVVTRRARSQDAPRSRVTSPIDIPTRPDCRVGTLTGSDGGNIRHHHDSDSELYADSDGEFEDIKSSLSLDIKSDDLDMEKWEPPRG